MKDKTCNHCGKAITGGHFSARICSDECRKEAKRLSYAKWVSKQKELCHTCHSPIVNSVGRYCSKECRQVFLDRLVQTDSPWAKPRVKSAVLIEETKVKIETIRTKEEEAKANLALAKQDVARAVARYGKQDQHRWLK